MTREINGASALTKKQAFQKHMALQDQDKDSTKGEIVQFQEKKNGPCDRRLSLYTNYCAGRSWCYTRRIILQVPSFLAMSGKAYEPCLI